MLLTHRDWKSKILIADDQPILRERIREMISSTADMAVIADIGREEDTLRTIALDDPDMLIMDISMEDRNCLETIREIKKLKPGMPILILSLYPEDQYPAHLLKEAGATGYLAKDAVPTGLLQAVRCILEGGTFFGSEESGTGRHI